MATAEETFEIELELERRMVAKKWSKVCFVLSILLAVITARLYFFDLKVAIAIRGGIVTFSVMGWLFLMFSQEKSDVDD